MSRRIYYADHTRDEIQGMFSSLPGRIADADLIARVHNLHIDGIRIGDSKPRLHKQYSNAYSKEENESFATATMLAQLEIDDQVKALLERDKPDIYVDMIDGPPIYIEVRLIENGRIRRLRFVEDLNHALFAISAPDPVLSRLLSRLNITIHMSFEVQPPMHRVLKEAIAFIKSILNENGKNERIMPLYPLMHARGARAFWSPMK